MSTEIYNEYRNRLESLKNKSVPTAVHYPMPIHQQPIFKDSCGSSCSCPVSALAAQRVLSLPMALDLTASDIKCVRDALHDSLTQTTEQT